MIQSRKLPYNPKLVEKISFQQRRHHETNFELSESLTNELRASGLLPDNKEISEQMVIRWKSKAHPVGIKPEIIQALAKHWSIVPEYLFIDEVETYDPIKYFADLDAASNSAAREYYEEERAERVRMENLFAKGGFRLTDRHNTAACDFGDVKPFLLSDMNGVIPDTFISDDDMKTILKHLHNFFAYECVSILNRKEDVNGND